MFSCIFQFPRKFCLFSFFLLPFNFILWSAKMAKSTIRLFFFLWTITRCGHLVVWLRLGDRFQDPWHFVRFILQGVFWDVHIPRIRVVESIFLAQFPLNYLPHPFLYRLLTFCVNLFHSHIMFVLFASITTSTTLTIFCVFSIFSLT